MFSLESKVLLKILDLAKGLEWESPVLKAVFPIIKSLAKSTGIITEELFTLMAYAKIETKRQ